jgi:hypothetical protein
VLTLRWGIRLATLAAALGAALAPPAGAATCAVPAPSHPTIGAALRDGNCTTIELAAGSYPENVTVERDVVVQGAGSSASVLQGYLAVTGATADVALVGLTIDGTAAGVAGCWREVLSVAGGAEVATGPDVVVLQTTAGGTACRLFADGFESGGVLAWSAHAP